VPKILPYTQWSLIMEMKEKGLWRPSTYATIVSTLLKRKYIIEIPKLGWLKHTKKWEEVYKFLVDHYTDLISEQFTKILEEKMDKVEQWEDHFKILKDLLDKLKSYKLI
jgi:reverse gyrase